MSDQLEVVAQNDPLPLIFTHYGDSFYLENTLKQASKANPEKRCILLGDQHNRKNAIRHGWEHFFLADLKSSKRDLFNARFKWVQGIAHNPVKGGQDWLRYVSERFYALETFLTEQNIKRFWHFDSDTMILHDLRGYEARLIQSELDCTTLCNDSCPSGFITTQCISDFTKSMIGDYEDEEFIASQQLEFDEVNPHYAFTEMRAFKRFRDTKRISSAPLSSYFVDRGIWFDDCICQPNGFKTSFAERMGREIKDLFSKGGDVVATTNEGTQFKFATVNCSWVNPTVFEWIQLATSEKYQNVNRLTTFLQFSPRERLLNRFTKTAFVLKKGLKCLLLGRTYSSD